MSCFFLVKLLNLYCCEYLACRKKNPFVNVIDKACLFPSNLINQEIDIFFLNHLIVNFNSLIRYSGMYIHVSCGYHDRVFALCVRPRMMPIGLCSEILKLVKYLCNKGIATYKNRQRGHCCIEAQVQL